MNQSDIQFRKNCQLYYTKINKLLKNGETTEAGKLINEIRNIISQWEENFRSTRFKLNLLRNTYSSLAFQERRANLQRRQQGNDSGNSK